MRSRRLRLASLLLPLIAVLNLAAVAILTSGEHGLGGTATPAGPTATLHPVPTCAPVACATCAAPTAAESPTAARATVGTAAPITTPVPKPSATSTPPPTIVPTTQPTTPSTPGPTIGPSAQPPILWVSTVEVAAMERPATRPAAGRTPSPTREATRAPEATRMPPGICLVSPRGYTYAVQSGDTLAGLARRLGTTAALLRQQNCLTSDLISAGSLLWVPRPLYLATCVPWAAQAPTNPPEDPPTEPPTAQAP